MISVGVGGARLSDSGGVFLDAYMVIYFLWEVVLWWVWAWLSLLEKQCYLLLSLSFLCFWRWNSVRVCLKNIDIIAPLALTTSHYGLVPWLFKQRTPQTSIERIEL